MTRKEADAFLLDTEAVGRAKSMTPETVNEFIRSLQRQNCALWEYACHKSTLGEVQEYLDEHGDDPLPFEW